MERIANEELVKRYQQGDQQALTDLFEQNRRMLHHIARRFHSPSSSVYEDLIQEGSIGMLRAAQLFDPEKGIRFSTYVYRAIMNRMSRLVQQRSVVKIPPNPHPQYQELVDKAANPQTIVDENHPISEEDSLEDKDERRWQTYLIAQGCRYLLHRERLVLFLRLEGLTLKEIAQRLSVSKEWIRQVERSAHEHLREIIHSGKVLPQSHQDPSRRLSQCSFGDGPDRSRRDANWRDPSTWGLALQRVS